MYNSDFCDVHYDEQCNIAFVKWKSFCCGEDYRNPLREAIKIMSEHPDCHYVADTRDGFENEDADTKWVFDVFAKEAYAAGCRYIIFIIDKDESLKDELEGQSVELRKYFTVKAFYGMDEVSRFLGEERSQKTKIRPFREADADEVSALVRRNFLEVNIRDYPPAAMQELAKAFDSGRILNLASYAHTYVVCEEDKIIGTGSISSFWGSETESILLTIFVLPEYHGRGIGRSIIKALESDELFLRAKRIEIPSSITACGFYEKMGYGYKDGVKELDDEGHYRMEKFR